MTENEAIEALKLEITGRLIRAAQFFEGIDVAIKALEDVQQYRAIGTPEECRKSVEICKSMIERNITPENMEEYMKFEDECVKNGFTFESLLKAREKQMAKKPILFNTEAVNQ